MDAPEEKLPNKFPPRPAPSLKFLLMRKFIFSVIKEPIFENEKLFIDDFYGKLHINNEELCLILRIRERTDKSDYVSVYEDKKFFENPEDYKTLKEFLLKKMKEHGISKDNLDLVFKALLERFHSIREVKLGILEAFGRENDPKVQINYVYDNGAISIPKTLRPYFDEVAAGKNLFDESDEALFDFACTYGYKDRLESDLERFGKDFNETVYKKIAQGTIDAYSVGNYALAEWLYDKLDASHKNEALLYSFNGLGYSLDPLGLLEYLWSKCNKEQKTTIANMLPLLSFNDPISHKYRGFVHGFYFLCRVLDPIPEVIKDIFAHVDEDMLQEYLWSHFIISHIIYSEPHTLAFIFNLLNEENIEKLKALAKEHIRLKYIYHLDTENGIKFIFNALKKNLCLILGEDAAEELVYNLHSILWISIHFRTYSIEEINEIWQSISEDFRQEYIVDLVMLLLEKPMPDEKLIELMQYFIDQARQLGQYEELKRQIMAVNLTGMSSGHYATLLLRFNDDPVARDQLILDNIGYFARYANKRGSAIARELFGRLVDTPSFNRLVSLLESDALFEFLPEITEGLISGSVDNYVVFQLSKNFHVSEEEGVNFPSKIFELISGMMEKAIVSSEEKISSRKEKDIEKFRELMRFVGEVYHSGEKDPIVLRVLLVSKLLQNRSHNLLLKSPGTGKGKFFRMKNKDVEVNPFDGRSAKSVLENEIIKHYWELEDQFGDDPKYQAYFHQGKTQRKSIS